MAQAGDWFEQALGPRTALAKPVAHSPEHWQAGRLLRGTPDVEKRTAETALAEKPPLTGLPRATIGTALERRTGCPAPGDPVSLTLNRDDSAAHSDSTLCMVLSEVALPVPMFWSKVTELAWITPPFDPLSGMKDMSSQPLDSMERSSI